MGTIDSIMALNDHSGFKYVYGIKFLGQSKDKIFFFKIFVDLQGSVVDLVKRIEVGRVMKNS
jgi:hypothetical protein